MASQAVFPSNLVLSDGSLDPEAGAVGRLARATMPLMIGLAAPLVLMMVIDPTALRHTQFLIVAILIPMLIAAVGIYAYSVLNPGEICGVVVDPAARKVQLVQANLFAARHVDLPFAEISGARVVMGYDRDGYATTRAELMLRSGDRVALPAGTAEPQVRALKLALGLA